MYFKFLYCLPFSKKHLRWPKKGYTHIIYIYKIYNYNVYYIFCIYKIYVYTKTNMQIRKKSSVYTMQFT